MFTRLVAHALYGLVPPEAQIGAVEDGGCRSTSPVATSTAGK